MNDDTKWWLKTIAVTLVVMFIVPATTMAAFKVAELVFHAMGWETPR